MNIHKGTLTKIVNNVLYHMYPTTSADIVIYDENSSVKDKIDSFNEKYDKIGGKITEDVKVDGDFILNIEDEDYTAGVKFTRVLSNSLGVILNLIGFADNTQYKTILRNIGTPSGDYDAANKKYVDERISLPTRFFVEINPTTSTITNKASELTYSKVKSLLTGNNQGVYLDVIFAPSRFYVKALQDQDVNNGPIRFIGPMIGSDGMLYIVQFNLASDNILTFSYYMLEHMLYKTSDIVANHGNHLMYPTAAAVYNQFMHKPDVIYETDGTTGLLALEADDSANVAWQLTGLDFSKYRRIKIHAKAGKGTTSASNEPAKVLEILLDDRGKANSGNYVGSMVFQNPNDRNRIGTLTCAISADKTNFAVLRMTSLYGTAASSNNGTNSYVYLIEGYYD